MLFGWLKRYMPRSLYGRAALILVLPVVTLQLVVSVVFIQRHFNGVTQQMTRTMAREIVLVTDAADAQPTRELAEQAIAPLTQTLGFRSGFVPEDSVPTHNRRRWIDFTGIVVIDTFLMRDARIRSIQLPSDSLAILYMSTRHGPLEISFERGRVSASNPHQLLVHMIFFGVLMTLISFVYLRNQLRPIKRLADAASAFGKGVHVPYHPTGAIEVRAAGLAFVDMRARIERQIEQRTMMLSGVSHDLRTPLTRLRLGLSMLEDEDARVDLEHDVTEMQRLVDEFLSFARGAQEGDTETVDPANLARQIVADASRAGNEVGLRLPEVTLPAVALRTVAVRRALENLIGNALRYGTHARLTLALAPDDGLLHFRVEDDGPGIPAEQREQALRPFVRLDPARNQDKGSGVGLGLAIAADIAVGHGGRLLLDQSADLGGLCADFAIAC